MKRIVLLLITIFSAYVWAHEPMTGEQLKKACDADLTAPAADPKAAWNQSEQAIELLRRSVQGGDPFLHMLLSISLANEFGWVNGDSGAAKTYLSRLVYNAQIRALGPTEKKIFLLQFHKLMTEGIITGFPKIQAMLDSGKYELETATSLIGDKFIFAILDEAEKANPATLTALLSVLNERKAFLGSKVVDAVLQSAVITSNKTLAEFVRTSGDRPSFEALADRTAAKRHESNQFATAAELVAMYDLVKSAPDQSGIVLPLHQLKYLVDQVDLGGELDDIASLIMNMDGLFTQQTDESLAARRRGDKVPEYFPPNQFSNRSDVRLLKIMKASFLARQLMDGVPFDQLRLKMTGVDLANFAMGGVYGGPSEVRLRRFTIAGVPVWDKNLGGELKVSIEWSPYDSAFYLFDRETFKEYRLPVINGQPEPANLVDQTDFDFSGEFMSALKTAAAKIETEQRVDLKVPQYEVDDRTAALLAKNTIPSGMRRELETILSDQQALVAQLNAAVVKENQTSREDRSAKIAKLRERKDQMEAADRALEPQLQKTFEDASLSEGEKRAAYYAATQQTFQNLSEMYPELQYAINGIFTTTLAGNHAFLFGPPGAAKTSLARVILSAMLKWESIANKDFNREMGEFAELFFQQFHKLLPEGIIVGFPVLKEQLESGRLEIDLTSSLAHKRFLFAILDEVEKANPAVLASLLSVLNEREVFSGNEVFKAGLISAILTSNKMPSEFLDYFKDDRPTGVATNERVLNKIYLSNKFSSLQQLVDFLSQVEAGMSPHLDSPLPLRELKPLADQVQIDQYVKHVVAGVYDDFAGRRLEVEETSQYRNGEEPSEFPDYYVRSNIGSKRTFIPLLDQLKSAFIVQQMAEGVPYEKLRYKIELRDLGILLHGLGYWSSVDVRPTRDQNGILKFEMSAGPLGKLKDAPYVNQRNRYAQGQIYDEATAFTEILNNRVGQLLVELHKMTARHPGLYPSLFESDEAEDAYMKKAGTP